MEKAFNLNVEGWLAYEYAKWERWLEKWPKNANLLLKGASQHEAAELCWCQTLGGMEAGKVNDEVCKKEEIPEAGSTSCFTNVPGARLVLIYVSGLLLLKV